MVMARSLRRIANATRALMIPRGGAKWKPCPGTTPSRRRARRPDYGRAAAAWARYWKIMRWMAHHVQ